MPTRESPPESGGVTAQPRRAFYGPNPYSSDPVVVAALAIPPTTARDGPARCARIATLSGPWFAAPTSFEQCDTPLGIADFLAGWTLAALNRWRGFLHAAKAVEEHGEIVVALGFHNPRLSRLALTLAVGLFNYADHTTAPALRERLAQLWELCARFHPDYQVTFQMMAAREAGIPYLSVLRPYKTWQFGWGARGELALESQSGRDSAIGDRISRDKPSGKAFLGDLGVPVPKHVLAENTQDLAQAAEVVGWPCVVKPPNEGRSIGVITDIADLPQLTAAVAKTLEDHGAPAMIESQVPGEVYRILVARGRVACVVRRAAPHVVGDGKSTVRQLIEAQNRRLADLRTKMDFVGSIPLDAEFEAALVRAGIGPDEVVAKGRKLSLRRIPLLESGAVYTDVTGETHPDTIRMSEMIAAAFGIENCGIDFITTDIARPMTEQGAVLEANTMPGLRVPLVAGLDPLAIGRAVLGDRAARVPATLLVATAERLAAIRDAATFDEATGWVVGDRAGVGSLAISPQDAAASEDAPPTMHRRVQMIVRNPFVSEIFIAAALEDVVEFGLPLDRFDRIACLGCTPDATWKKVLRDASGSYVEAKDLPAALRACGLAAPAKAVGRPRRARRSPAG